MKATDFTRIMHRLAPPDLACDWDNPGFQSGPWAADFRKIAVAMDATPDTVAQAAQWGADLLLTHHPLLYKAVKRLDPGQVSGRVLTAAAAAGLSIFSAHTNWDGAQAGVAATLASLLGLGDCHPLEPAPRDFYKLVAFVPEGYEAKVKDALFAAGCGSIGGYGRCWYGASGEGGFQTPPGGHPFIGQPGEESHVLETRLEMILPASLVEPAALALRAAHPYEEPAFEFVPVKTLGRGEGIGMVGRWPEPRDLLAVCREKLPLKGFKWSGPRPDSVQWVALVPGSGASYMNMAMAAGAEALVTADASYHQALDGAILGLSLVDLGHFETEWPGVARLKEELEREIARGGYEAQCRLLAQEPAWTYERG